MVPDPPPPDPPSGRDLKTLVGEICAYAATAPTHAHAVIELGLTLTSMFAYLLNAKGSFDPRVVLGYVWRVMRRLSAINAALSDSRAIVNPDELRMLRDLLWHTLGLLEQVVEFLEDH